MPQHLQHLPKARERILMVVVTLILLAIVSAITTFIFWIAGGAFKRGLDLAIYSMVMVYLWTLVIKVSHERYEERTKPEACRVCGCPIKH